jgi:hypothetical protein
MKLKMINLFGALLVLNCNVFSDSPQGCSTKYQNPRLTKLDANLYKIVVDFQSNSYNFQADPNATNSDGGSAILAALDVNGCCSKWTSKCDDFLKNRLQQYNNRHTFKGYKFYVNKNICSVSNGEKIKMSESASSYYYSKRNKSWYACPSDTMSSISAKGEVFEWISNPGLNSKIKTFNDVKKMCKNMSLGSEDLYINTCLYPVIQFNDK